ncbi:MAG: hypothetical protein AB7F65_10290 [Dehalococcoidia bacterium]
MTLLPHPTPLRPVATVALALAALLVACDSDGSDDAAGDVDASAIVCSAAYRVSQQEPLTEVDTLRFEDADAEQSLPYIYLELHGAFSDGREDGERSLRVWVTRTAEPEPLVTHLYQLPEDGWPRDQFVGGHGFTGLNYAYDPVSGAELQYWCATE